MWRGTQPSAHARGTSRSHASGDRRQNATGHQFAATAHASTERLRGRHGDRLVVVQCRREREGDQLTQAPLDPAPGPRAHFHVGRDREWCAQIHRHHGASLLTVKDNQPPLREDLADLFADRSPDRRRWQQAETWDKAHGRLEQRPITTIQDWFAKA